MALILLTNDDGIGAEGLRVLEESIAGLAEIVVVAPDRERSAVSHGLTLRDPLDLKNVSPGHYTLNGTPADCVIYSLTHVISMPPDLVISGINHGANLGDDIMYSGTVAGAREASRYGIASLAISQAYNDRPIRFKHGARFIRKLVETVLEQKSYGPVCLNVNIPVRRIRGVKITRQGCADHRPHFNSLDRGALTEVGVENADPASNSEIPLDFRTIVEHFVSITPLQRDQTDYVAAQTLAKEAPKFFPGLRFPGIRLIR